MWFIIIVFLILVFAVIGKSLDYSSNKESRYHINISINVNNTDSLPPIDNITDPDNPINAELQEELFDEYE